MYKTNFPRCETLPALLKKIIIFLAQMFEQKIQQMWKFVRWIIGYAISGSLLLAIPVVKSFNLFECTGSYCTDYRV